MTERVHTKRASIPFRAAPAKGQEFARVTRQGQHLLPRFPDVSACPWALCPRASRLWSLEDGVVFPRPERFEQVIATLWASVSPSAGCGGDYVSSSEPGKPGRLRPALGAGLNHPKEPRSHVRSGHGAPDMSPTAISPPPASVSADAPSGGSRLPCARKPKPADVEGPGGEAPRAQPASTPDTSGLPDDSWAETSPNALPTEPVGLTHPCFGQSPG